MEPTTRAAEQERIPLGKLRANIAAAKKVRPDHRFVALVATGSFAPVHKMHFEMFEAAKRWLEEKHNFTVVVGWISPSHDHYVTGKMVNVRSYPISGHHRVEMCRVMADKSDWIEVSSYEARAMGFINFPSVARYHAEYVAEHVQEKVRVMYLGGADLIEKCGLLFGISAGSKTIPVVAVGRPGYTTPLKEMVAASVRRRAKQGMTQDISHLLYIVLTETLNFSSTKVRELLERGESVAELCGEEVEAYLQHHDLHKAFLK